MADSRDASRRAGRRGASRVGDEGRGASSTERVERGPGAGDEALAGFYRDWKREGRHLGEYASEGVGTAVNVFCVVGVVSVVFGASSPVAHAIPAVPLRLFIVGLLLGGVGWLVALSPPGKLSGAHLNPAVSLGFGLLGKMHARDVGGYVGGQMAGAILGAVVGVAAFGRLAREVAHATLHPGAGVGPTAALLGEGGATFALTFLIYTALSHARLRPWTPALVTVAVGVLVWLDGNYSGAGMNPARWFGPAASVPDWSRAWVYVAGPLAGSAAAALLRRSGLLTHPLPHSGKIVHDRTYRSIFKDDAVPSTPPHAVRRRTTGR